jgi:hypothetical protein
MQDNYDTCESHYEYAGPPRAKTGQTARKMRSRPVDECNHSGALQGQRENHEYNDYACFVEKGHWPKSVMPILSPGPLSDWRPPVFYFSTELPVL